MVAAEYTNYRDAAFVIDDVTEFLDSLELYCAHSRTAEGAEMRTRCSVL